MNVHNQPPIASLAQLQQIHPHVNAGSGTLVLERIAAITMAKFEVMWNTFVQERSFNPFMDLYLKRWLHSSVVHFSLLFCLDLTLHGNSDQLVTITTTDPPKRVRIVGITSDHGLLRTVPEPGLASGFSERRQPEYIDLQPDGNSFDLMAGLIRVKT